MKFQNLPTFLKVLGRINLKRWKSDRAIRAMKAAHNHIQKGVVVVTEFSFSQG